MWEPWTTLRAAIHITHLHALLVQREALAER